MAYTKCPWCHEQAYAENDNACSNPHCQGPESYCTNTGCGWPLVNAICENPDCYKSPLYNGSNQGQSNQCTVSGCPGIIDDEIGFCTNESNHDKLLNSSDCVVINYYSNYATWAFEGALNREQVSGNTNVCVFQWIIDRNTSFPYNLNNYVNINDSDTPVKLSRDGYEGTGDWVYYLPEDGGAEAGDAPAHYIQQDKEFANYEDACSELGVDSKGKQEVNLFADWRSTTTTSYLGTLRINFYIDGKPYIGDGLHLPSYSVWAADINTYEDENFQFDLHGNYYNQFGCSEGKIYEVTVDIDNYEQQDIVYKGNKSKFTGELHPGDEVEIALHFISKKTITYNANGGNWTAGIPDKLYGFDNKIVILSELEPSRTGYVFAGWGLTSTATTAEYLPGGTITIARNLVLYAVWSPICCTINYYSNCATSAFEGALNPVSADTNVLVAQRTVYANQDFTNGVGIGKYTGQNDDMFLEREGYKGTGYWGTSAGEALVPQGYTANSYEDFCSRLGINPYEVTSIDLYPQWQKKQYCPDCGEELDDNGNCVKPDCPSKIKSYTLSTAYRIDDEYIEEGNVSVGDFNFYTDGSAEPIHTNAFDINHEEPANTTFIFVIGAKNGYKYVGAVVPDDVSIDENSETVLQGSYPAHDFEVVFDFRSAKTITYSANGGLNAPAKQTTYYDVKTNLSSTIPVRDGYTFIGWALDPNETESDNCHAPGAEFTTNKDVTLYAVWQEIVYATVVHFKYADSTVNENTVAAYHSGQDFSAGISLPDYTNVDTKEGYLPTGYWCTSEDGTGKLIHQDTKFYSYTKLCEALGVSVNENNTDIYLYTQWKPLPAPGTSNVRIKTKNGWVVGQLKGKRPSGTATAVVVRVKTQNGWK